MGFGEYCRFKSRAQEPIGNAGGSRFHSGVFVGIDQRTGQYMIYADDTIKLARTVTRVPEAEKWNTEALSNIRMTPYSMHVPNEPEVIFKDKPTTADEVQEARPNIARQLYLKPDDVLGPDGCGLTRGCPKCDYYLKYQLWGTKPQMPQSRPNKYKTPGAGGERFEPRR